MIRTDDGEVVDFRTVVSGQGVESRTIAGHAQDTYRGEVEAAVTEIGRRLADDWAVVLTAEGKGMTDRMAEVLTEHEYPVRVLERLDAVPAAGMATVVQGDLPHGFVADGDQAGPVHRRRPVRTAHRRQGDPQDAGPAQEHDRPAGAHPR